MTIPQSMIYRYPNQQAQEPQNPEKQNLGAKPNLPVYEQVGDYMWDQGGGVGSGEWGGGFCNSTPCA
jgi:hypothetical protein